VLHRVVEGKDALRVLAERGEARTALRAFATGNIEPWIAEQPWEPATCGWTVAGELHG
jgi:hypothetical protein